MKKSLTNILMAVTMIISSSQAYGAENKRLVFFDIRFENITHISTSAAYVDPSGTGGGLISEPGFKKRVSFTAIGKGTIMSENWNKNGSQVQGELIKKERIALMFSLDKSKVEINKCMDLINSLLTDNKEKPLRRLRIYVNGNLEDTDPQGIRFRVDQLNTCVLSTL